MKRIVLLLLLGLLLSSSQAKAPKEWNGEYVTATASYLLYSGSLGEKEAPQSGHKKISLLIEGRLARELFDSLGPDQKQACGASTGVRIRERGDITCSFDRAQKTAPFTCFVGLNLNTGKSIAGAAC